MHNIQREKKLVLNAYIFKNIYINAFLNLFNKIIIELKLTIIKIMHRKDNPNL